MLSSIINFLGWRKLDQVLDKTKTIKIKGVKFIIKKVDVLDYSKGAQVMLQSYDIYKTSSDQAKIEQSEKKIKEHYSQVLVAGVVEPKLSHKEGEGILVSTLFVDWDIVNTLYNEIMTLTYGKKKLNS